MLGPLMVARVIRAGANDRMVAWITCATAIAVAAILRLFDLSAYGLETDEVFSVMAARANWDQMFATVVDNKSHPPLHYILVKLSLGLGSVAETWARIPSVLFGVGLVPVAFALCRQLGLKQRDTLLVLVLVATNGVLIYFAQYARMFAALEFFAALSFLLFTVLWGEFSWRLWALLTIVNVLMIYSHYWGAAVVATECLLMALSGRKKTATMALSAALTGLAFLPWAVAIALAALRQGNLAGQISWMGTEVAGPIDYLWLIAALNGFLTFHNATRLGLVLFAIPVLSLCLSFAFERRWRDVFDLTSPGFWIVLIVTPMLLTSLASIVAKQNLWGERHLSIVAVPYYLLIGLSLTRLRSETLANMLRCAILVWAIGSAATYVARDDKRFHWELVAATIASGDPAPVYVSEWFVHVPLGYYLESKPEIPVTEERDLAKFHEGRFWYVYRDTTWTGVDPQAQLASKGFVIGTRMETHWWQQTVTALLVEKPARNPQD